MAVGVALLMILAASGIQCPTSEKKLDSCRVTYDIVSVKIAYLVSDSRDRPVSVVDVKETHVVGAKVETVVLDGTNPLIQPGNKISWTVAGGIDKKGVRRTSSYDLIIYNQKFKKIYP